MSTRAVSAKRAVVLSWKEKGGNRIELFSNLKNLCLSYPQFNYNTLNNYLSKSKIAFENELVRIERKPINLKPLNLPEEHARRIVPVMVRRAMKEFDEKEHDLEYWLSVSPVERLRALAFIVTQSLKDNERMDKTIVRRINLKA
ncbi:MAG: hypothetical protein ABIV51_03770 [Saprospiraceae bacterium]